LPLRGKRSALSETSMVEATDAAQIIPTKSAMGGDLGGGNPVATRPGGSMFSDWA